MKYLFIPFSLLLSCYSQAQFGINTRTPTEIADVNGNLRVRSLPTPGTTNAIYTTGVNTNSGNTPTQTYTGNIPIIADDNNVIGKVATSNLTPNNTTSGFDTTNNSTAMFVIKRYITVPDNPNFNTGMSADTWEAVMSNIRWSFTNTIHTNTIYTPATGGIVGYLIRVAGNGANRTWRIYGDINGIDERSVIDVLFIRKSAVAADTRTNVLTPNP